MSSSQVRTLIIIILIQAIAIISWAAIQEKPMKKNMGIILNQVINADLDNVNNLERYYLGMKNYQLFVYVGTKCQQCQIFNLELQKLASEMSKQLNVVLVYDYSSQSAISLKDSFAQTSTYEFLDSGIMYHQLFSEPTYMSYVLTGPKHTILSDGKIVQSSDIQNLKPLITSH